MRLVQDSNNLVKRSMFVCNSPSKISHVGAYTVCKDMKLSTGPTSWLHLFFHTQKTKHERGEKGNAQVPRTKRQCYQRSWFLCGFFQNIISKFNLQTERNVTHIFFTYQFTFRLRFFYYAKRMWGNEKIHTLCEIEYVVYACGILISYLLCI